MKEIGGYIEFEHYHNPFLHEGAIALNCGRNCLDYLIQAKKIKKILLPYFLCDSVKDKCLKKGLEIQYYHIDTHFLPTIDKIEKDAWLYVVNFYGQLSSKNIIELKERFQNIIVDNAQAYFDLPIDGTDTIYTCRKFFGVADGAFLYTDKTIEIELPVDESFDRMHFLLGRFERTASEFYTEYADNNHFFINEPVKSMSKLTQNLLRGIDYERVKRKRTENFNYLYHSLQSINKLKLKRVEGGFAYPLWIEKGQAVKKRLSERKIYIPTLWPNVLNELEKPFLEYEFANNILPLPVDQRYGIEEMKYIFEEVNKCIS